MGIYWRSTFGDERFLCGKKICINCFCLPFNFFNRFYVPSWLALC